MTKIAASFTLYGQHEASWKDTFCS